jgi:hypothetical protein
VKKEELSVFMLRYDKIDINKNPVYGVKKAAAELKYKKFEEFSVEIKVQ